MLNAAHVLEIALLLLVAFLIGASLGTLLRLVALRFRRPATAAAAIADTTDPFPVPVALVSAPVIVPLPKPGKPAEQVTPAPEQLPVPDFAAAMLALATDPPPATIPAAAQAASPPPGAAPMTPRSNGPKVEILPARKAGEATAGRRIRAKMTPPEVSPVLAAPSANPSPETRMKPPRIEKPSASSVIPFPTPSPSAPPTSIGPAAALTAATEVGVTEQSATPTARDTQPEPIADVLAAALPILDDSFIAAPAMGLQLELPAVESTTPEPTATEVAKQAVRPAESVSSPEPVDTFAEPVPQPEPTEQDETAAALDQKPRLVERTDEKVLAPDSPQEVAIERPADAATAPAESTTAAPDALALPAADVAAEAGPEPLVPAAAIAAANSEEDEEAAAMRAIEGNWTPSRTPAHAAKPAELPEGISEAVVASRVAVAKAAKAIEAVVVEAATTVDSETPVDSTDAEDQPEPEPLIEPVATTAPVLTAVEAASEPGQPLGLSAPRHGQKDDFTQIIGILPGTEAALNALGLYHFEQLAELGDEHLDWVDAHLGLAGGIRREHWREQARELGAAARSAKSAAAT